MGLHLEENQAGFTVAIDKEKRNLIYVMYDKLFAKGEKKKQFFRTKIIEFGIAKALEHFEEFKKFIGR